MVPFSFKPRRDAIGASQRAVVDARPEPLPRRGGRGGVVHDSVERQPRILGIVDASSQRVPPLSVNAAARASRRTLSVRRPRRTFFLRGRETPRAPFFILLLVAPRRCGGLGGNPGRFFTSRNNRNNRLRKVAAGNDGRRYHGRRCGRGDGLLGRRYGCRDERVLVTVNLDAFARATRGRGDDAVFAADSIRVQVLLVARGRAVRGVVRPLTATMKTGVAKVVSLLLARRNISLGGDGFRG